MEEMTAVQLPRWQCHKQVYGDRIKDIRPLPLEVQLDDAEDSGLRWYLDCGAVITVSKSLIARSGPKVGDYFVQYEDGYQSWSPATAFKDGYTRI